MDLSSHGRVYRCHGYLEDRGIPIGHCGITFTFMRIFEWFSSCNISFTIRLRNIPDPWKWSFNNWEEMPKEFKAAEGQLKYRHTPSDDGTSRGNKITKLAWLDPFPQRNLLSFQWNLLIHEHLQLYLKLVNRVAPYWIHIYSFIFVYSLSPVLNCRWYPMYGITCQFSLTIFYLFSEWWIVIVWNCM